MNTYIDVYKAKIEYDGSIDKLKSRVAVRGDLKKKELVGDNWSPIASMRTLKYSLEDAVKHKARVHQLYLLEHYCKQKNKNRLFVKLDSKYADYFQNNQITLEESCNYLSLYMV